MEELYFISDRNIAYTLLARGFDIKRIVLDYDEANFGFIHNTEFEKEYELLNI